MINIIKASIFKLFRDKTFQITMIIGGGMVVMMSLLYYAIDNLSGNYALLVSTAPGSNFTLTVPINLIVFTVGEFTYGTIRNKVIAGISKTKIYLGLFITGLLFTFILVTAYVSLMVAVGSIVGGFDPSKIGGGQFIGLYIVYTICTFVFVTALSVFFASLIRAIGGSTPIVIVLLVMLSLIPLFTFLAQFATKSISAVNHWSMWINPLYMNGFYSNNIVSLFAQSDSKIDAFKQSTDMILAGILTPLLWSAVLVVSGLLIFNKRDIK
jgi:ABC-type transport system involved in multi-copper enzyme maturation permease subunit